MQGFQRLFMTWRTHGRCSGCGGLAAMSGMGPHWKHVWVMGMPPIFAGALMFITAPDGYLFCLFCFFPPRYLVIYPYSPLVGRDS